MAKVILRDVKKNFGKTAIIKGINLEIRDREFIVFVGPSGCGKSTLLRLIAGLEEITAGDLFIGEQRLNDCPPAQRGIAMVFQSYALYPHKTAYDNMAFGLKLAKKMTPEMIKQKVHKAAEILQIKSLLDRKPKELSGGQRQRVAIGRAIVREPKVFLFDEPLSNLDAALRIQMRVEIARLHQELNATMIYVTHDQTEAMTLADRIVVLSEGEVQQVGAPLALYHHPRNQFVASFIGSPKMNFLEGRINAIAKQSLDITLPGDVMITIPVKLGNAKVGDQVTVGIRPEHLRLNDSPAIKLKGYAYVLERLGSESYLHVKLDHINDIVTVRTEGDTAIEKGERIEVGMMAENCHVFDADGEEYQR